MIAGHHNLATISGLHAVDRSACRDPQISDDGRGSFDMIIEVENLQIGVLPALREFADWATKAISSQNVCVRGQTVYVVAYPTGADDAFVVVHCGYAADWEAVSFVAVWHRY
jgi:hypothetical protein